VSLFKKREAEPSRISKPSGERRQLTVLFYDIVGSTSLVGHDDPEALRARLDLIHMAAREALTRHGGSLEQVMGDGGMAYFGYPIISEDAALSAVTAALELLAARNDIPTAPDIRIGIATSVVVLPDQPASVANGQLGAVGVAPNLAARLESAAGINSILVSPATFSLTQRAVDYTPVEGLDLKGFPDVARVWRPLALRTVASRFERDRDGSGAFTGRTGEITELRTAWESARNGAGTAKLLEGEPGIGKSRILSEVAAFASDGRVVLLQCQPRTQGDALFSIIRMYDHAYEDASDPALAQAAERTAQQLNTLENDESLNPAARREGILTAVSEELLALSRQQPLLLLAEDLHWADEITLAVLDRLASRARHSAILILATSRVEVGLNQSDKGFAPLRLAPISRDEAQALIKAKARTDLKATTRDWIVNKADGNPLFLTELTAFAEETLSAGGQLSDISGANIGSLNDLLSARLQSAGIAKRTAQLASILGREYSYVLLSRLNTVYTPQELDADLQRLVDHGLMEVVDSGYTYAFLHALLRDGAYDSQLRSVREALHSKVVDMVETDPTLSELVPDILLAEHCIAANRIYRGVELLLHVAEDAIRLSALRAPRAMLERVLSLSADLEPGRKRDLLQIKAITLLGPLVTLLEGPRSAAPLYEQGQAIYFSLPASESAPFFPILWGWWFTASDLIEQTGRSEVMIRNVAPGADAESRLQALHCGWATLFDGGAHDRCLSAISEGLALYDPEVGRHSRYLYGHDAKVCGLGERALSGWLTGQLDLSANAIAECEAWGDATAHLSSQLHGLDIATQVAFFNHDLSEIDRILTKMASLSDADAVPAIVAKQQIFRSWIAARAGDRDQIEAVTKNLAALRNFGVLEDTPFYADIAADVVAASGDLDAALGPLHNEITEARKTGLTYWLPELLRRKAVLSKKNVAIEALDEGFEMAQSQNAQMLALRNFGTRLDLGLALPREQVLIMRDKIDLITPNALHKRVRDALDL